MLHGLLFARKRKDFAVLSYGSKSAKRQADSLDKRSAKRQRIDNSSGGNDSGDDDAGDDDSDEGGTGLNARMFEWLMFYDVGVNVIHFPGNSPDSITLHQYVY